MLSVPTDRRPACRAAAAASLLAMAAAGCTPVRATFECTNGNQCVRGGVVGRCEPTGYCGFADPQGCASGWRYDPTAGPYANTCVPPGTPGVEAGPGPIDVARLDGRAATSDSTSSACGFTVAGNYNGSSSDCMPAHAYSCSTGGSDICSTDIWCFGAGGSYPSLICNTGGGVTPARWPCSWETSSSSSTTVPCTWTHDSSNNDLYAVCAFGDGGLCHFTLTP